MGRSEDMDLALRRLALPFFLFPGLFPLILCGCHASYSPNTYSADAAQQEASVQRGVIVGARQVLISPDGTVGAAAGGRLQGRFRMERGCALLDSDGGRLGGRRVLCRHALARHRQALVQRFLEAEPMPHRRPARKRGQSEFPDHPLPVGSICWEIHSDPFFSLSPRKRRRTFARAPSDRD